MTGSKGKYATWFYEDYLGRQEGLRISGADEVGRGAWAFCLTCAAACYDPKVELPFQLRDSKKYTLPDRERLVELLTRDYIDKGLLHVAYGEIDALTIEKGNLNTLNLEAFRLALEALEAKTHFDKVIYDGDLACKELRWEGTTLVQGDMKSITVATASIFAKVRRDRQMKELHQQYSQYGFDAHMGYGTEQHKAAIIKFGPIPGVHRSNFLNNLRRDGLIK
jgi:ribonuclease HII